MRKGFSRFPLGLLLTIFLLGGSSCLWLPKKDSGVVGAPKSPRSGALSGCSICHANVEIQSAKSKHVVAGITCADCHGESEGHILDENNEAKPDRVFARADIDSFCESCHQCSLPKEKRVLTKICTDCHPAHIARIPVE